MCCVGCTGIRTEEVLLCRVYGRYDRGHAVVYCAGCTGVTTDLLLYWLFGVTTEDVLCIVWVVQVIRQRTIMLCVDYGCCDRSRVVCCAGSRGVTTENMLCVDYRCYDRSRVVCCAGSTGVTTEDVLFNRLKVC